MHTHTNAVKEAIQQRLDPKDHGIVNLKTMVTMLDALHIPDADAYALLQSSDACFVKYNQFIDYLYSLPEAPKEPGKPELSASKAKDLAKEQEEAKDTASSLLLNKPLSMVESAINEAKTSSKETEAHDDHTLAVCHDTEVNRDSLDGVQPEHDYASHAAIKQRLLQTRKSQDLLAAVQKGEYPEGYSNTSGQWAHSKDEVRLWAGSMRLNCAIPSKQCLRELLYGDPNNSAKEADVIVVYITEFHLDNEIAQIIRGLLRECVEDPESYIFNEDDKGLGIKGIPADFVGVNAAEKNEYRALYICVHTRLAGDTNDDDTVEFQDTFPTPPAISCGAPSDGLPTDEYTYSDSVMMQSIMLRVPSGTEMKPLHLVIIGAELSASFVAQQYQLARLQRHLQMMRKLHGESKLPFTAVFIGNTNHQIVASEEFMEHVEAKSIQPKKRKSKKKNDTEGESTPAFKYRLKPSGVEELCRRLEDPVSRQHLFSSSSLNFIGKDCFGIMHERPPHCAAMLSDMFELSTDWMLRTGRWVPLPTTNRTSLEALWSILMGFQVMLPEVVTVEMLEKGTKALHLPKTNTAADLQEWYLPSKKPEANLKTSLGKALYMQLGWLDGVGAYKRSTCEAAVTSWHAHTEMYCFDHVPVKGSVQLSPEASDPLRVWVGTVKLDHRHPSKAALQEFLYGTSECSAKGADVIALFMTDIDLNKKNVKDLRNLLFNTLHEEDRDQYIFNEQEQGLTLQALPVNLMKISNGKLRYNGLFVCAKKSLCRDFDEDGNCEEVEDIFPFPPESICRSDRKNETAPSFKGHMAQNVVLNVQGKDGKDLHLLLVGTNFATEDDVRARQIERLGRHTEQYHREEKYFAAIIFGDFNNRMVCPDWLAPHVTTQDDGHVLSTSGISELCTRLASESESVMRSLDSWYFTGKDAIGTEVVVPDANRKLREMFHLHIDLTFSPGSFPNPTYKRVPLGEVLTNSAGFQIDIGEVVLGREVDEGIRNLQKAVAQQGVGICGDLPTIFFGGENSKQRKLQIIDDGEIIHDLEEDVGSGKPLVKESWPVLNCGWPDVIGVLRSSVYVQAELLTCAPCETIFGPLNHAPIRGKLRISISYE